MEKMELEQMDIFELRNTALKLGLKNPHNCSKTKLIKFIKSF